MRDRLGSEPGPIVFDESGAKLGEHKGAYTYTIGQRRGLGITVPTPTGEPRYVLRIEPKSNTVVVGEHESLAITRIIGERAIWCGLAAPAEKLRGYVQVRAHGDAHPCTYWSVNSESDLIAELDEPVFGLATGQAMVIYDNDRVVGSATIAGTE